MPAVFELNTSNEQFLFQLIHTNGDLLLIGKPYADKSSAEQAIKDVRVGSLMSNQLAKGKADDGSHFFVIKNGGGKVVAKSDLIESEMEFDNILHTVKDQACIAEVLDNT